MRPWCNTWRRKQREKERFFFRKNAASSSKQYYFIEYLVFLKIERADKKQKIGGKTGEATTVAPGMRITTLRTTTNKLGAGPAAKFCDNDGQMRRSHVFFGLVATCDAPGTSPT